MDSEAQNCSSSIVSKQTDGVRVTLVASAWISKALGPKTIARG